MNNYLIILEKYSGRKSRYTCPSCNKANQFTRYINSETNEHINSKVGKCNRIEKCTYHYTPKEYFQDNKLTGVKYVNHPVVSGQTKEPSFIAIEKLQGSLQAYGQNNFVIYLKSLFGENIANKLVDKYRIGSSKKWYGGSTVFWQIDTDNRIRTGKIMKYDSCTGKRLKEPFRHISWVHTTLQLENFNLNQCLFGSHLLNQFNFPVAIVESEKTAIISSAYFPSFTWLASGSLQNLKYDMLKGLKERSIILFPDTSLKGVAFDKWKKVSETLSNQGYNCLTSDYLEINANIDEKKQGVDLADYLVKYAISEFHQGNRKVNTAEGNMLERLCSDYPTINKLIERFELTLEL